MTSGADAVDVEAAADRIAGVAHRTPVVTSRALDRLVGAELFLKAENQQCAGAFKFRGAYNRLRTLAPAELGRGIVTSSSGNHAQALSLAAALCGTRAVVLMPGDAPASKRAATTGYGGEVIGFDRYRDDRERLTAQIADERGLTPVHAYDDPQIISGAGTAGLELLEDAGPLDMLFVSTGGGGLLAGCCVATQAKGAETMVYAVEPEASDDWSRSLRAGRRERIAVGETIADGQQLPTPGRLNFEIAGPLIAGALTVSDDEILTAMRLVFERTKMVVEPSGATALAAVLARKVDVTGLRVGITLSGGNVDVGRFCALFST
ncbi:MAG TPA: pyridoxal-phosphate dependent enzyme [Solirubrobacterales bacterium]